MEASVQLARATCAVLRGLDFDAQLCVRGTLLLGQMMRWPGSSPARAAALEAGAPNVLLSILETQVRLLCAGVVCLRRPVPPSPHSCAQAHNVEVVTAVLRVLLVVGATDASALQVRLRGGSGWGT